MKKLVNFDLKTIILYIVIDIICVGVGMGVPFFCIILGFPLGWYLSKKALIFRKNINTLPYQILRWSFWTSTFTFLLMIVIWGGMISAFFNPSFDFKNFGHPFILFDPKASFVGWLVLMVFVSPFLQLLTTIFAAFVFLASKR